MDNKLSSPEAIKILVSLVEVAQRRGAFSIDESYLAFHAIHTFTNEKKYDDALSLINNKLSIKSNSPL
jgi:Neuraminidase (sialidase)